MLDDYCMEPEMNKVIKKMWKKAEKYADMNALLTDELEPMTIEHFAELIVAECMEVFSKDLPEEGDGKMLEVVNRVCNVAEHFGVK